MGLVITYQNYKGGINNLCVVRDLKIPYIMETSKIDKEHAIKNYKALYKKYYRKNYKESE